MKLCYIVDYVETWESKFYFCVTLRRCVHLGTGVIAWGIKQGVGKAVSLFRIGRKF